ncbi:MAG: preprotein translocase subunit SecA [Candidatus Omnitrophota bacterium]|nr:preprotein translocase subunit SecA [Candidatus Omnitrophota bacterium]
MLKFITNKIIGTQNERQVKRLRPLVSKINAFEPAMQKLSDAQLRAKTEEFREKIKNQILNIKNDNSLTEEELEKAIKKTEQNALNEILPEAFAVVREVGRRTINMRHFDVQLIGGMVLHQGKIAEMSTGEGKTLVATLSAYLNALLGKGVHIITVNDYLARRDREWMGPIYEFLGLSVGVIQHDIPPILRRAQYACDITYGTNNEFGFDYLRDNMVVHSSEMVQRPVSLDPGKQFYYAIVDEVDSILIDEARTPLIISGPAEESTDKYYTAEKIVKNLKGRRITQKDEIEAKYRGEDLSAGFDYVADEKARTVALSEEGERKVATSFGVDDLHSLETIEYRHHIMAALRAKEFFSRDTDYVVKDGQVIIVDEFTGRLMPGRRWSDGLHQAVESKEGLKIERENQTLATVTLQNYFRMYEKLSGMTGTAMTEAQEFKGIYKLDTVSIPTNKPLIRSNFPDCIYKTEKVKFDAVVEEIAECFNKGRPILVGTISIEKSERLSGLLKKRGIPHNVLNAKYHELEAHIVAQAGHFKAVTIATNMAGRGTDILLGGNAEYMAKNIIKQLKDSGKELNVEEEYKNLLIKYRKQAQEEHDNVVAVGGLHIIGTERHEARRIDNQLRGRSGRQGDPGSSRFYVSLADDLMRLFGSEKIIFIMEKLGMPEEQAIEHPWISRSIETAQRRVEAHNFEIRKQLLEYDNVMNKQREVIYSRRRAILEGREIKEELFAAVGELLDSAITQYFPNSAAEDFDAAPFYEWLKNKFSLSMDAKEISLEGRNTEETKEIVLKKITGVFVEKEEAIGLAQMVNLIRMVMLQVIDTKWKDHLYTMDNLREGIGLRAYGHRDPLIEYQNEAFNLFTVMMDSIGGESVELIFNVQAAPPKELKGVFSSIPQQFLHLEAEKFEHSQAQPEISASLPFKERLRASALPPSASLTSPRAGRNDPCPCGSGKKYKKCCGR